MAPAVIRLEGVAAIHSGALSVNVTTDSSSACEVLGQVEIAMSRTVLWGHTRLEKSEMTGFHSDRPRLLAECPIQ